MYSDRPGELVLVATDRVSVYDVVLPTPIPDKGKVLTALSLWWFEKLAAVVPNHVLSADDVPGEWKGRAVRCREVDIIQVECIARGYLAGLGWEAYSENGTISGVGIPAGLVEGDRLAEPVFTPTTKTAPEDGHDEPMTFDDVVDRVGTGLAERLKATTLELYRRAAAICEGRGVLLADTKFEFGLTPKGELLLADEVLTSDSSRYWRVEDWKPGQRQVAYDKQYVRDWVFAPQTGKALNPNSDYHAWKALLQAAGVRDGRLHDARHTAATVLLVLGVPERTVMGIMGWSSTSMAARYQHITDPIRRDVAKRVGGLLWSNGEDADQRESGA